VTIRHGLPRWVRRLVAFQLIGVTFAIVYAGEHYVVDAVVGVLYGLAASIIVARALGSGGDGRADAAAPAPSRPAVSAS
jgi:hypothetical protein